MKETKCKKQSDHQWICPSHERAFCEKCFFNKEDEYDVVLAECERLAKENEDLRSLQGKPLGIICDLMSKMLTPEQKKILRDFFESELIKYMQTGEGFFKLYIETMERQAEESGTKI